MIIFEKVQFQNFLSVGNHPSTIQLNKSGATLITGKNGTGKSTLLDAITFALFGKPFRNISKKQLLNSINGKGCLVEIWFTLKGSQYHISRGINPNILHIEKDGELISEDASHKDYQKVLEQQILRLNYKTFTQVVILGSATFVPFMQLPAQARREVIEEILDIKIFSVMGGLLKEQYARVEQETTDINNKIDSHKVEFHAQKKLLGVLQENKQDALDAINDRITRINEDIVGCQQTLEQEEASVTKLNTLLHEKYKDIGPAITHLSKMMLANQNQIDATDKTIRFFEGNTTCPSCSQDIADDHKKGILDDLNEGKNAKACKHNEFQEVLDKLNQKQALANTLQTDIQDKNIYISTLRNNLQVFNKQRIAAAIEVTELDNNDDKLTTEKDKYAELVDQAFTLVDEKEEIQKRKIVYDVASTLLKDGGIKASVVREYLPVMNLLINRYLSTMDFFVKFELDDKFHETIKSRGRDSLSYSSFSEGEKQRINLAILLMWRQLARMKNSVNTNLLIMDEVFDSSLDANGVEILSTLISDVMKGLNVFIISHREQVAGYNFDNTINVKKVGDFTVYKENT